MLRHFIKEIILLKIIFRMYWTLHLSSRIAPGKVTLPLKYLKQNLSLQSILFDGHIDCTAK